MTNLAKDAALIPKSMGSVGAAALRSGLLGAGVGGVVNGVRGYQGADPNATLGQRLGAAGSSALTGAATGGVLGAGVGGLGQSLYRGGVSKSITQDALSAQKFKSFGARNPNLAAPAAAAATGHYNAMRKTLKDVDARPYFWGGGKTVTSSDVSVTTGVDTRQKMPQRGFHHEKAPGFHALKSKFEEAAKKGLGKEVKLASDQVQAIYDVLEKFSFLRRESQSDDPIRVLSEVLRNSDFGFGLPARDKASKKVQGDASPWGQSSPIDAGDAASRLSTFNGGMSYTGV